MVKNILKDGVTNKQGNHKKTGKMKTIIVKNEEKWKF